MFGKISHVGRDHQDTSRGRFVPDYQFRPEFTNLLCRILEHRLQGIPVFLIP